jgi:hypothetical protein
VARPAPHWDALQGVIAGEVVNPGSPGYDSVRRPAIARFREVRPGAVVLCEAPEDVSETISFARRTGPRTATRSGGTASPGAPRRKESSSTSVRCAPWRSPAAWRPLAPGCAWAICTTRWIFTAEPAAQSEARDPDRRPAAGGDGEAVLAV